MDFENNSRQTQDAARCDRCGRGAEPPDGEVLRCDCGSLLARYVGGRVELKCRRCKRTVLLPVDSAETPSS